MDIKALEKTAAEVRVGIVKAIHNAGSGHPGGSLSAADIVTALYFDEMNIIGITGTNGKTRTAYLLYQALNKLGIKCGYIGTIGYYLKEKV